MIVSFQKIRENAQIPTYAHPGDAGMDLRSCEGTLLQPGEYKLIHTGLTLSLPKGTEAQIRPRSGLAFKHGITVLNAPGTIDEGYRGEIGVLLINHGKEPFEITPGMRISQMVFASVLRVECQEAEVISDSERGTGGFGSTGV